MRCEPMLVYVAGPYTLGDVAVNVRAAIDAGNRIMDAGHIPFVPHLTHFWHIVHPRPYEDWLAYDNHFVPLCQALVRLPGDSKGADAEVALARGLLIPVFYSVESFLDMHPGGENDEA